MLIPQKENTKSPDRAYNQATDVLKSDPKLKASCQIFPFILAKYQHRCREKKYLYLISPGKKKKKILLFSVSSLFLYAQTLDKESILVTLLANCSAVGIHEQHLSDL